MARWTGTWLSGLAAAGIDRRATGDWPGRRLGLPEEGPEAAATTGARVAALVVDIAVGWLIGGLVTGYLGEVTAVQQTVVVNGAFALQLVLLQALTGQSIGMRLVGIRVTRASDPAAVPGLVPAAARTALILLVVPAVILDRDRRGLHDKAAGTVVVRAAGSRSFAG
jgi:uncharacterized RDD family membrane protein YckC